MTTGNVYLLERFNAAFNKHDVGAMMDLLTLDCVFENTFPAPDGTRYQGWHAVRDFWADFFVQSPQAHIQIEEMMVNADRGAQRWVYTWVNPDGSLGHVRGVDVIHFRDGKILAKFSYVKG